MMNWLKTNVTQARAKLAAEASKFKNKSFMEAVVAGCAMVAAADGHVSSEEKQKMAGYIQNADELKHFNMAQVIASFDKVIGSFDFDAAIGKAEAMKIIGRIRASEEQARMLVRVVCAIGAADGDFDADERRVAAEIATELGLNPVDFDL